MSKGLPGAIHDHGYEGPLTDSDGCTHRRIGRDMCGHPRTSHAFTASLAGFGTSPLRASRYPRSTEVWQATTRIPGLDIAVDQTGNLVLHVAFLGAYTIPNLDGLVADLETARQHALQFARRPDLYSMLAVEEPNIDPDHILNVDNQGEWTIMHPLACRPNLFKCPTHLSHLRSGEDVQMPPGRYRCGIDAEGRFVLREGVE